MANVITLPASTAPLADLNVAVTRAGFPGEMEVRVALLFGSVMPTTNVGVPAAEPVAAYEIELPTVVGVVAPATVVWPVTVTVPAPEAVDALNVTEATPLASVNAVPMAGSKRPSAVLVSNVITAPEIAAPLADLNVALTRAGLVGEIVVRGVLLATSVSVTESVGTPTLEPVVEYDTEPFTVVGVVLPTSVV